MSNKYDLNELSTPMRDLKKEFDLLVEPHRNVLWRYCLMITRSPWDAEDLVQETLLKTFGSLSRLVQPVITKSYLFRIATNTWINELKKANVSFSEDFGVEETFEDSDPFDSMEAIELLVYYLSPQQRVAVLLFDILGFSGREVANMIGTTEGAVKALLHRARKRLKKAREDKPDEILKQTSYSPEQNNIIEAYLDAFNRRDPDGIARLMDEQVLNDIVHTSIEYGKEIVRKHSLEGWANDPMPMKAINKLLWNKPTIVVIGNIDGTEVLYDLIHLEIEDDLIIKKRDYYFCQDLLQEAGDELGLPVHINGYIYQGKDD
jgi:RNA polymerase sigma factor (sigma-70 family)